MGAFATQAWSDQLTARGTRRLRSDEQQHRRFVLKLRRTATALTATAALALAGCGSSGSDATGDSPGDGKQIFADAGCASCHALEAAGSSGGSGPDLGKLRLSAEQVAAQVEKGGGGMPAYAGDLSPAQIKAVSEFVADNGPAGN